MNGKNNMGKTIERTITNFSKGMTNDSLISDTRFAQLVRNFDISTDKHKLIPFRSSEDGDSGSATSQKQNFTLAIRSGVAYNLFSLGVKSGGALAEVLRKTLGTGGSGDMGDNGWSSPTKNQAASGSTSFNLFVYYKYTTIANSRIFGASGGTRIWSFDPTSTEDFDDAGHNLTYTNIAQGLVHTDDILYIPYDNKIAKNNQGAWTDIALTLPANFKITSIASYGNYLAIAVAPLSNIGNSKVFLWDTTSTSWNEEIDWGRGSLQVLDELDGFLVGVSYNPLGIIFKPRVIFKYSTGGKPITFRELINEEEFASGDLPISKQKANDSIYFLMSIKLSGNEEHGLWRISRTKEGAFSVVMDRTPNNDTALTSGSMRGFFFVGDYLFLSYLDSSAFVMSKTNNSNLHAITGTYDIKILNDINSKTTKKLIGVTLMTEFLPANGKVSLSYKKDEETSFTKIFDNTTLNSISHSAINIESSGLTLPEFKELTLRLQSTAKVGATTGDIGIITGLKYHSEIIGKDLY